MSTARRRSAEWGAELARRSNTTHDRTKAEAEAKAAAEAEERGRIGKWADELRDPDRRSDRREEMQNALFPPNLDEADPSPKPQGSADGGVGEPEQIEIERPLSSPIEDLRIYPLDNNPNNDNQED